jgi:hypothetical protein
VIDDGERQPYSWPITHHNLAATNGPEDALWKRLLFHGRHLKVKTPVFCLAPNLCRTIGDGAYLGDDLLIMPLCGPRS